MVDKENIPGLSSKLPVKLAKIYPLMSGGVIQNNDKKTLPLMIIITLHRDD
jgi:hypothetical protein